MNAFITRWIAPFWLQIAIAAAIVGWGLAATFKIQIEGLRIWPIHIVGWREENGTLKLDLDKIKDAQVVAAERQKAANDAEEARHAIEAERNNRELETLRAAARAATERYRMRSQAAHRASGYPTAPADDNGPQGVDGAGEGAVMVSGSDLDILVENTVRLKAAVEWAKTLNVVEPAK